MNPVKVAALAACSAIVISSCGQSGGSDEGSDAGYPGRGDTVKVIIGYSAGGPTDVWARILTDALSKETGARFQVVNKPGAGGQIGLTEMLNSPKDGSVIGSVNLPSALKYLYPDAEASYTREDFSLVASTGYSPNVIVVPSDSPYRTLTDLFDEMRARPGKLNAAADGALSDDTIAYNYLKQKTGVDFNTVVVDGGAEKVTALLGKQVDFFSGSITTVWSQLQAKQFRPLAVFAKERSQFLPDVPTAKEQGVDVLSDNRWSITMAAGAPDDLRQGLEDAIKKVSQQQDYLDRNADAGIEIDFLTGEQLSQEWARQEDIVRQAVKGLQE